MSDFNLSLTGAQIDAALNKVHNADTSPVNGSANMVTSDGVHDAVNDIQFANFNSNLVSTDLSSGNNNTTIPTTQAVANLISSGSSNTVHICTASSQSGSGTWYKTGWNTYGSSAVTTNSEGLTISGAGVWLCSLSAHGKSTTYNKDYDFKVFIDGGTYLNVTPGYNNMVSISCSFPYATSSSFTFKVRSRYSNSSGSSSITNPVATFYKLA